MKNCRLAIVSFLLLGVVIGLFLSPSFWGSIEKSLKKDIMQSKEFNRIARSAMTGKKVSLASDDTCVSAAVQTLIILGASYAPREEADYCISVKTKGRFGFKDLDFCDHNGRLLHRVSVFENDEARVAAQSFAWSLAASRPSMR